MLLNPGQPYSFNGNHNEYPDIRLVYWCGGNPFHHHQDLNRLREAWKQPETIIVHEPWWTATQSTLILFFLRQHHTSGRILRVLPQILFFHMPELISPLNDARDDYRFFLNLRSASHRRGVYRRPRRRCLARYLYQGFQRDSLTRGLIYLTMIRYAQLTGLSCQTAG
ncbi:MAG: hypothetical protein CM1200mP18_05280 [Gammaproteobacteria bacterium]|nr:MAG: hypothetical protein CM1200mP18_05280 [Gammaproteobacteria bacterium]